MQFQHLFVQGPTHFKEQIERLQIAVTEQSTPKIANRRLGRFCENTETMLNALLNSPVPLNYKEVSEIPGLKPSYCSRQLAKFLERAESYGIKAVNKGNSRAYTII